MKVTASILAKIWTVATRASAILVLVALPLASCERVIGADFGDTTTVVCRPARPPPPPSARNAGGEEEVLVAITSIDVGDRDLPDGTPAFRTIGFDLDNACANQGQRPTCKAFSWANPNVTDGVDGIDNSGGALMHAETDVFGIFPAPFSSSVVGAGIRDGTVAPLAVLRLRGYNLRVVDDDVALDWYVAEPYATPGTAGATARFDGTDEWPIWERTVVGPVEPGVLPDSKYRDPHAYVTDYKLVAKLPNGTPFRLQNVPFPIEGLTVVLNLAYDPFRVVSGVLGGHLRAPELFAQMPRMTEVFGVGPICKNDVSYPRVKSYFCKFIDSHHDGRNEPDAPCDGVSLGIRFETTIVRPGPTRPGATFKGCPPETDPGTDSCAVPAPPL